MAERDDIAVFKHVDEETCRGGVASLFSEMLSDRMKGNRDKLHHQKLSLHAGKMFFTIKVVKR